MSFKKLLSVVCLLVLVGCATEAPTVRLTIAGGQKLIVSMKDGRVEGEQSKYMQVGMARFLYNLDKKQGSYTFVVLFDGSVPASVTIEDVSDSKAVIMVQDQQPVLKEQVWHHECPSIGINDPSVAWMHDIDDSFRVYRFTVVLRDGQKVVLHYASTYPGYVKTNLIGAIEAEAKKAAGNKAEGK
jgi:hypothetical protein